MNYYAMAFYVMCSSMALGSADDADINTPVDSIGFTKLHGAVIRNEPIMVAKLIKQGANVNSRTKYQTSPLHVAASKDLEIVSMLLENGAEVNARDAEDKTPLHEAARYNMWEIVTKLIDQGADVDAQDSIQQTPLHFAAINA